MNIELRKLFHDGKFQAHTWPGGYPIVALCADGESLCPDCVNDPSNPVHVLGEPDNWKILGAFVHYEGKPEVCSHCGKEIESAYGDPFDPLLSLVDDVIAEQVYGDPEERKAEQEEIEHARAVREENEARADREEYLNVREANRDF